MRLAAFPAEAAFLPALANAWMRHGDDPSEGVLILPNRRSARALAGAFLASNDGKPMLLPRIIALGAIDEAALIMQNGLDFPPAISPLQRQAILSRLILARHGRQGAPTKLATAWALAADLAALLDEADMAEIDLNAALPDIVESDLASHWQKTLEFLDIVTHAWPAILAEAQLVNPGYRQNLIFDAQSAAWEANPPAEKIWLVTAAASPALCRLARTIANLPNGAVILPGYDHVLDSKAWDALDDTHPQAGISKLLTVLGARYEDVELWAASSTTKPNGRSRLISKALLPAASMGEWQAVERFDTDHLYRLAAKDENQEALAIAMILRDALEIPGQTAALITPDRDLANKVSMNLRRFGIIADDSAGEPLGDTPPATFIRLLARAVVAQFSPVHLLGLLKHPLTAVGIPPEICRDHARQIELEALRGPRPSPGFQDIRFRLAASGQTASIDFLVRLEMALSPVISLSSKANPAEMLRALIKASENLAASEAEAGSERLWSGEAGVALSEFFSEIFGVLDSLPDIAGGEIAELIDAVLAGQVLRRPRTKDGHPRIAIWGVQEASLQTVDLAILGGLVEDIWPAPLDPGPWLNRPMRKAAGLPAIENRIGLAAKAFFDLCCQCPRVVLSSPLRRERAPALPARWITRLNALLSSSGDMMAAHPAASWAAQIDLPSQRTMRPKPEPRPKAAYRPKLLSISDFAMLMADPYAVYAKKILNIKSLKDLDEESDSGQFGNIVHAGLADFFSIEQDFESGDATDRLTAALMIALRKERPRAALEYWWNARLTRIANWIVDTEQQRRCDHDAPGAIAVEKPGSLMIDNIFTLTGRVDRIERRADGRIFIVDYKTGVIPGLQKIQSGAAPQLLLEAVMAEDGSFGRDFQEQVAELAFWKLTGRRIEGEVRAVFADAEILQKIIEQARQGAAVIFKKFASETMPYLANPQSGSPARQPVYDGVSRRAEWATDGGGYDEPD